MLERILICTMLFSSIFVGCSKKKIEGEPIYTEEEFNHLTADLSQLNPVGENAIPFAEYSPKVNRLISKAYKYERLRFYAIGFDTVIDARNEAIRLNQYYSKNYMFDQVEGEPILEDMVITQFKAINPNKKVQRVPKKHESGHEEKSEHGADKSHH